MELGSVTKLDKRNKIPSKKIDDDVMSENYDAIVIFPTYGQFGAIWKPDCERIVYKTDIFINRLIVPFIFQKFKTELKYL